MSDDYSNIIAFDADQAEYCKSFNEIKATIQQVMAEMEKSDEFSIGIDNLERCISKRLDGTCGGKYVIAGCFANWSSKSVFEFARLISLKLRTRTLAMCLDYHTDAFWSKNFYEGEESLFSKFISEMILKGTEKRYREFRFYPGEWVKTPFNEKGIIEVMAFDGDSNKYLVITMNNKNWYKESALQEIINY